MIMTAVLSTESDKVEVTFAQDEVQTTTKMTKTEFVNYISEYAGDK